MDAPKVSEQGTERDRRTADKLERSPGSFFIARGRDLTLAAPYFNERLPDHAYTGTSSRHFMNLCAASYAAILSAFELTWKSLYARIVDTTSAYDANLLAGKGSVVTTESILAHREQASAGSMLAASLGTWQDSEKINERFQGIMQRTPIPNADKVLLADLWQVRHIIAHSSGILGSVDVYRLSWDLPTGSVLHIDRAFLDSSYLELRRVVEGGVRSIGVRLLDDFFDRSAAGSWSQDRETFGALYLLGKVVGQQTQLPDVEEADYNNEKSKR